MDNFFYGLMDNDYSFVDTTEYDMIWDKFNRDFINRDFTL